VLTRSVTAIGLCAALLLIALWESPHSTGVSALWHLIETLWQFVDTHNGAFSALFAAAVAVFTRRLWVSTRDLWSVTSDTLRHTEIVTQQQLRAYLSVEPGGINQYGDGSEFLGHVGILNKGRVPARNVSYAIKMEWKPGDHWTPDDPGTIVPRDLALQPGTEMKIGSPSARLLTLEGGLTPPTSTSLAA
jgi:hypothetical protein